ncbi:MAG: Uma2 family endonuclease [Thiohalocapsa sp.]
MEATQLETLDDLLLSRDGRVELIGGEVVDRPMTRFAPARAQSRTRGELHGMTRGSGPGGRWIVTDVSVAYEPHECPSHDLAGWRRERLSRPPDGVIDLPPDWVCEIVSPGHEKKDTVAIPLLLKRHQVPWLWLIWPEDRALIAHRLDGNTYRVFASLKEAARSNARIPPFDALELDLAQLLGGA